MHPMFLSKSLLSPSIHKQKATNYETWDDEYGQRDATNALKRFLISLQNSSNLFIKRFKAFVAKL